MREIKFRVWDSELNFMYSGTSLIEMLQDPPIWKNHYVLEQYTGLKDKNGVEIYEGDIVKNYEGENLIVEYRTETASYDLKDFEGVFQTPLDYTIFQCKVIGNIHEVKK